MVKEFLSGLKRPVKIVSIAAAMALLVVLMTQIFVSADGEIDEVNPELTLLTINSDAEQLVDKQPLYTPDSVFQQGEEADGGYHIETNAYVPWMSEDDVAFAYKQYNVKDTGDDYIEAVLTVESAPYSRPGTEPHAKASLGLMFRSGLENNDGHVFIQVRGHRIMAVYRTQSGESTSVQYSNEITYPVQMRMHKQGNTVKLSYRCGTDENWTNFTYGVGLRAKGPLYVGIAANSSSQSAYVCGDFSTLTVKGIGTYDPNGGGTEEPEEPDDEFVEEDPPVLPDTLLRETFTDGDFYNKPESNTNPIWNKPDNYEIVNIEGNRKWFKNFNDYEDFVGSQDWTDYMVSVELEFSEDCNPDELNAKNLVKLYARHMDIPMYGNRDYYVAISAGYKISIGKRSYEKNDYKTMGLTLGTVDLRTVKDAEGNFIFEAYAAGDTQHATNIYNCLGDGQTHTLALKAFDNVLTAYWDGIEVLQVTDNGESNKSIGEQIFAQGSVGISSQETSVYIDNLTVTKLEDVFGGDYDNEIEGNWNQPIPGYIEDWAY